MNDPTEEDKPEDDAGQEEENRGQKAPLNQLTQTRYKETGQGGYHVACRALSDRRHTANKRAALPVVYPAEAAPTPSRIRPSRPVVERPGTSGRMRISARASSKARFSSASSESGV